MDKDEFLRRARTLKNFEQAVCQGCLHCRNEGNIKENVVYSVTWKSRALTRIAIWAGAGSICQHLNGNPLTQYISLTNSED